MTETSTMTTADTATPEVNSTATAATETGAAPEHKKHRRAGGR
jgi:hypothetical protein